MTAIVTKNSLQASIDKNDINLQIKLVGTALVRIMSNQTAGERQSNSVNTDNGTGFTGADGKSGTITAKYYNGKYYVYKSYLRIQ